MRREVWLVLLTFLWVVGGVAALIRSEAPRGRVVGKVVAAESGQALADVAVWFEHPRGSWRIISKQDGSFELPNLPAGTYTVHAYAYAHRLEPTKVTLQEGETKSLLLALEPATPFLELVHPQSVFYSREAVKVGVRGFVPTEELRVQVWQIRWQPSRAEQVPLTTLLRLMGDVRQGWWRGVGELRETLQQLAPCLVLVSETTIPITQRDTEGVFLQFVPIALPHDGLFLVRIGAEHFQRVALVMRTRVGLVTKVGRDRKNMPTLLAFVADLRTGEPIKGVAVSAWMAEQRVGREFDRLLAKGVTDANGLAHLPLSERNLAASNDLFIVAHDPSTKMPIAWVKVDEDDWRVALPSPTHLLGIIYTDRPVYRPANTVHFKGIVRRQTPHGYRPVEPTTFTVVVRDPDDNIVHQASIRSNEFGSFSGSLTLNEEAPTGTYTLEAVPEKEGSERIMGSFIVAAYRKPEVQVIVKPTKRRFVRTETVTVEVVARYYFGLPVAGAKVSYRVTRLPMADEREIGNWGEGYGGEGVLEGETHTDADGRAIIRFRPDHFLAEATPFTEFRYEVSVTVEAMGYQFAEGTSSFLVTQGDWRLTVWCEPSFAERGATVFVKGKVTHWDTRKPQPNAVLQWRAGVMKWKGKKAVAHWLLRGESTTDEKGETRWQFVPTESGDWIVEAIGHDRKGNTIGATANLWVVGRQYAPTFPPQVPPLQLWLDKRTYRVGETATVAVRSKAPDATVLVTVEGERLYEVRVLRLKNGMAQWQFPVSPDLLPNAYVTASLVWRKQFTEQSEPLRFALDAYRLQVSVRSDKEVYEPREKALLTVQVRDAQGKPVKAEVSLAVVDEAIYAIREDNPEQVFQAFYAERLNRIVTRFSFPLLIWQGDKGAAETARRFFPDTALWLPHVVTDEKGQARLPLTVPDTLTQWRITAIAHTLKTHIGFGIARFRCSKPFGVRLSVPLVATQGDTFLVSAIVHNGTMHPVTSEVHLRLKGALLTTFVATPSPQKLTVPPHKTATAQWQFHAAQPGKLTIVVSAKSNDGHHDSEERTLTLLPHGTEQVTARAIFLPPDVTERLVTVTLPNHADLTMSRLTLRLAPSVLSAILGALGYLVTYPYGCVEQTMNSLLPNLMVWQLLQEGKVKVPWLEQELPRMVERGLTRLYRFQHDDGGWGWWEDDSTYLWMTALVVRGLSEAKRAGFEVSEHALTRGIQTLQRMVREEWQEHDADSVAFALFALARAGAPMPQWRPKPQGIPAAAPSAPSPAPNAPTPFPAALFKRCSPYGLAFLCLALQEWQHPAASSMARQLLKMALPLQEGLRWGFGEREEGTAMRRWTQDDEVTAWALLALMRTNQVDAEEATNTVKTLLWHRKGSGWVSTKDTAAILEALLEFTRRFERYAPLTPIAITLSLNGSSQTVNLAPDATLQSEQVVPLSGQLRVGKNEVRIAKPAGVSLWVTLVNRQVLTLPERMGEWLSSQRLLQRRYERLLPKVGEDGRLIWQAHPLREGSSVRVGELVRVTLTVECPTDFMVLEDPLPAGFRVVERESVQEQREVGEVAMVPKEVRDDRTVTYFRSQGTYTVRYLLRAELPGEYHILPPRLWHMYGTDRWLGAEARLSVRP